MLWVLSKGVNRKCPEFAMSRVLLKVTDTSMSLKLYLLWVVDLKTVFHWSKEQHMSSRSALDLEVFSRSEVFSDFWMRRRRFYLSPPRLVGNNNSNQQQNDNRRRRPTTTNHQPPPNSKKTRNAKHICLIIRWSELAAPPVDFKSKRSSEKCLFQSIPSRPLICLLLYGTTSSYCVRNTEKIREFWFAEDPKSYVVESR